VVFSAVETWQDAERNAAEWMRSSGFTDARVTTGGADAGIDVCSREAIAQVKFQASAVGRPALQQLVGARGRDSTKQLLFFTATSYSANAVAYAETMGIALFTYGPDGSVVAINRFAKDISPARIIDRWQTWLTSSTTPQSSELPLEVRALMYAAAGVFLAGALFNAVRDPENYQSFTQVAQLLLLAAVLSTLAYLSVRSACTRARAALRSRARRAVAQRPASTKGHQALFIDLAVRLLGEDPPKDDAPRQRADR